MERNNHGDCTTNQAAFDAFCDQSPESPGHTCALSILEAAALGSSLFGCVGHRARRLHMGLPQMTKETTDSVILSLGVHNFELCLYFLNIYSSLFHHAC